MQIDSQERPFESTDWRLLGIAAAIFGSSFLFMAQALEAFSPSIVTFLRIMFGAAALTVFPSSRQPIEPRDWPKVALLGVVWFAAPLTLFPLAQQRIDSSLAGMINGATPLATALIAACILRRLPRRRQLAGLALGFLGISLITIPSATAGDGTGFGIALGIGAILCYGVAFNLAAPLQGKYGSMPVLWRALLVAAGLTVGPGLAGLSTSRFSLAALLACAFVGVFGTGVAYVATAILTGRVGSTRSSLLTYVATPISIALGLAVRDEAFVALAGLGAALTLAGAYVASRPGAGSEAGNSGARSKQRQT